MVLEVLGKDSVMIRARIARFSFLLLEQNDNGRGSSFPVNSEALGNEIESKVLGKQDIGPLL